MWKRCTRQDESSIRELIAEGHDALKSPRQITRFLCGITSPATTRARLRQHEMFGAYGHSRFQTTLDFVQNLMA